MNTRHQTYRRKAIRKKGRERREKEEEPMVGVGAVQSDGSRKQRGAKREEERSSLPGVKGTDERQPQ